MNRLTERIFHSSEQILLKGGSGLLARSLKSRFTKDIDFATQSSDWSEVEQQILESLQLDLGDHLSFARTSTTKIIGDSVLSELVEIKVDSYFGGIKDEPLKIQVALYPRLETNADLIQPALDWGLGKPVGGSWRLIPIAQQVADKVAATLETKNGNPSSRVKDLVDITLIASEFSLARVDLTNAINEELARRNLVLPATFEVPASWAATYSETAARSSLAEEFRKIEEALSLAQLFLDLEGKVEKSALWDPKTRRWVSGGLGSE